MATNGGDTIRSRSSYAGAQVLSDGQVLGTNGDKMKLEIFIKKKMTNMFDRTSFELNILEGETIFEKIRCQYLVLRFSLWHLLLCCNECFMWLWKDLDAYSLSDDGLKRISSLGEQILINAVKSDSPIAEKALSGVNYFLKAVCCKAMSDLKDIAEYEKAKKALQELDLEEFLCKPDPSLASLHLSSGDGVGSSSSAARGMHMQLDEGFLSSIANSSLSGVSISQNESYIGGNIREVSSLVQTHNGHFSHGGSTSRDTGKETVLVQLHKLSMWRKLHLVYSFFVARRVFSHIVTFTFYCIVIPTSILVPEVTVPKLGVVYIPTTITILNSVGTPSSFHLIIFWIFFENVMSLHRMRATLSGIFEVGKVNEWIVTKKLGSSSKAAKTEESIKRTCPSIINRVLLADLGMSMYLFICATIDFKYGKNNYFFYIYPQAVAFFIMGLGPLGLVGTVVPN